jgi:hypothetical protein
MMVIFRTTDFLINQRELLGNLFKLARTIDSNNGHESTGRIESGEELGKQWKDGEQ